MSQTKPAPPLPLRLFDDATLRRVAEKYGLPLSTPPAFVELADLVAKRAAETLVNQARQATPDLGAAPPPPKETWLSARLPAAPEFESVGFGDPGDPATFADVKLSWGTLNLNGVQLPSELALTSRGRTPNLDKPRRARPPEVSGNPADPVFAFDLHLTFPPPAGVDPEDVAPYRSRRPPPTSAPRRGSHVEVRHGRRLWLDGPRVDDVPPPHPRLPELYALADVKFTGTASTWDATVCLGSDGVDLELWWSTLDRDTGAPLRLVYHHWCPWSDFDRARPLDWLQEAIRYVFRHEAEETLVLADGTRPFDPHLPGGRLKEPPR